MRLRVPVVVSVIVLVVTLLAACTDGSEPPPRPTSSRSGSGSPSASASPAAEGGRALATLDRLCPRVRLPGGSSVPAEGPTPDYVRAVQREVSEIRGLDFTKPVPVDAVTHAELVEGLEGSFNASYPRALLDRRSRAWETIGVVEPETDIRAELEDFASGQVIGYYDTIAEELVFIGTDDPSPTELVTLAHELTHALDDQHFGLQAVERLGTRCRDDAFAAALAVAEGDATYVMLGYAQRNLTLDEQLSLGEGGDPGDVARFILRLEGWPYLAGLRFVQALVARGGTKAIDGALVDPPVSSEQVLHPESYPDDVPQPVDIGNVGRELGDAWRDLDVQEVGEGWLATMLGLRMDADRADEAAAGWDGGIYRAWSNGSQVAVVMSTVWDSTEDASAFAAAMTDWIASGDEVAEVRSSEDDRVDVLFASDPQVIARLDAAA
jgi:hypothetical protein